MGKKVRFFAFATLATVAASGVLAGAQGGGAVPAADAPGIDPGGVNLIGLNGQVDLIQAYGSDTTIDLMQTMDKAYNASQGCEQVVPSNPWDGQPNNTCRPLGSTPAGTEVTTENWDHDAAVSFYPQGSGNGRRQLCLQDERAADPALAAGIPAVDYARSSSGPSNDCGTGETLRFVAFAQEAVTWVVSAANAHGVTDLSQSQLVDIFVNCTLTTWEQLGGTPGPIHVWGIQNGSGTNDSWDAFLGGDADSCVGIDPGDEYGPRLGEVIFENNFTPVAASDVADDSIFAFATGPWTVRDGGELSALGNIDGVGPFDAAFPNTRLVYNVVRSAGPAPSSEAALRYVGPDGWICKAPSLHSRPSEADGEHSGPFGFVNPLAQRNYADAPIEAILSSGFAPLVDPASDVSRCEVFDV